MCTVSWWQKGDSYGVLFNRDESRRRQEARPPSLFHEDGISFLSPVDPDGGGTWIWVNTGGLIGCVLNNYPRQDKTKHPASPVSRGLLLKSLASHKTISSVEAAIGDASLAHYRPFFLLFFSAGRIVLFSWDGELLDRKEGDAVTCPLTTSGYKPEEVSLYRKVQFEKLAGGLRDRSFEDLVSFHCQHDPDMPACSVLMSRPDARTVSQSHVRVEPDMISFSYAAVFEQVQLQPAVIARKSRV